MTTPDETELLDLIPPEAEIVRRIVDEVRRYPRIRRPLLRFLAADDFDALMAAVEENSENIKLVLERMGVMDERMGVMDERFASVDRAVQHIPLIEDEVRSTRRDVNSLRGEFGRFRGDSYEDKCRQQIDAVLDGHVTDAVLADREHIQSLLRAARHDGRISRNELIDGYNADIIARSRDKTPESGALAVVEASITFNRRDVENSARRAALIGRVARVATVAYVVTHHDWPADMDVAARAAGVTIIQYPLPQYASGTSD